MLLALVYSDKFLLVARYVCTDVLCLYVSIVCSNESVRVLKENKCRVCKLLVGSLAVRVCHKVCVLGKGIEA